jgi:hypothetical protein
MVPISRFPFGSGNRAGSGGSGDRFRRQNRDSHSCSKSLGESFFTEERGQIPTVCYSSIRGILFSRESVRCAVYARIASRRSCEQEGRATSITARTADTCSCVLPQRKCRLGYWGFWWFSPLTRGSCAAVKVAQGTETAFSSNRLAASVGVSGKHLGVLCSDAHDLGLRSGESVTGGKRVEREKDLQGIMYQVEHAEVN